MASESQSDLIARAVGGDSLALQQLLVRQFTPLERHIELRIPGEFRALVAAQDVLQDAFIQTARDIVRFRGASEGEFFVWLRTIAEHRLFDTVKALKRQKRGGGFRQARDEALRSSIMQLVELTCMESHTPGRSAVRRETAHALQVHVSALPEDQRDAIRARYFQGLELPEIAKRMGRTPGAIRGLIHRAQQKLAQLLGQSSRWFDG